MEDGNKSGVCDGEWVSGELEAAPPDSAARIEAILFAAGAPVRYEAVAAALNVSEETVRRIALTMQTSYDGRGIELICLDDACQLCTKAVYEGCVRAALGLRPRGITMSASSLETLAIIAYRQPVTRAYIEQVRGVESSYSISVLSERHMIEATGRLDVPGRPLLYQTTDDFLRCFGLNSLGELPPVSMFGKASEDEAAEQEKGTEKADDFSENEKTEIEQDQ